MAKIKFSVEAVTRHLNERSPREKIMIVILAGSLALFLDYLILVRPIVRVFFDTMPRLASTKQDLHMLGEDRKNKELIEQNWKDMKELLTAANKSFVEPNEIPAFLENLSKLAQETEVKIMSLNPADAPKTAESGPYTRVPISLSAAAGTHAFGRFLAKLESQKPFIRVTDIKITANPMDMKRHQIELKVEAYRKGA